ncbi:hypothetical protein ACLBOM_08565 [Escherichia coli]
MTDVWRQRATDLVSTTGELAAHGQVLSGGDMQLKGQGLDLSNSRIQGQYSLAGCRQRKSVHNKMRN